MPTPPHGRGCQTCRTLTHYSMTPRAAPLGARRPPLRRHGRRRPGRGTLGLGALAAPLVGWKDWPSALTQQATSQPVVLAKPYAEARATSTTPAPVAPGARRRALLEPRRSPAAAPPGAAAASPTPVDSAAPCSSAARPRATRAPARPSRARSARAERAAATFTAGHRVRGHRRRRRRRRAQERLRAPTVSTSRRTPSDATARSLAASRTDRVQDPLAGRTSATPTATASSTATTTPTATACPTRRRTQRHRSDERRHRRRRHPGRHRGPQRRRLPGRPPRPGQADAAGRRAAGRRSRRRSRRRRRRRHAGARRRDARPVRSTSRRRRPPRPRRPETRPARRPPRRPRPRTGPGRPAAEAPRRPRRSGEAEAPEAAQGRGRGARPRPRLPNARLKQGSRAPKAKTRLPRRAEATLPRLRRPRPPLRRPRLPLPGPGARRPRLRPRLPRLRPPLRPSPLRPRPKPLRPTPPTRPQRPPADRTRAAAPPRVGRLARPRRSFSRPAARRLGEQVARQTLSTSSRVVRGDQVAGRRLRARVAAQRQPVDRLDARVVVAVVQPRGERFAQRLACPRRRACRARTSPSRGCSARGRARARSARRTRRSPARPPSAYATASRTSRVRVAAQRSSQSLAVRRAEVAERAGDRGQDVGVLLARRHRAQRRPPLGRERCAPACRAGRARTRRRSRAAGRRGPRQLDHRVEHLAAPRRGERAMYGAHSRRRVPLARGAPTSSSSSRSGQRRVQPEAGQRRVGAAAQPVRRGHRAAAGRLDLGQLERAAVAVEQQPVAVGAHAAAGRAPASRRRPGAPTTPRNVPSGSGSRAPMCGRSARTCARPARRRCVGSSARSRGSDLVRVGDARLVLLERTAAARRARARAARRRALQPRGERPVVVVGPDRLALGRQTGPESSPRSGA